jgi:hypothetical protein
MLQAEEMARALRIESEDAVYHLRARGNARQAIFRAERDCARCATLANLRPNSILFTSPRLYSIHSPNSETLKPLLLEEKISIGCALIFGFP